MRQSPFYGIQRIKTILKNIKGDVWRDIGAAIGWPTNKCKNYEETSEGDL